MTLLLLTLAAIFFVIWCRVFALAATEEKPDDKIVWSLVTFFGGPFGVLMYLLIRYPVLKGEQQRRDFEMLRAMREEFEKKNQNRAAAKA